MGVTDATEGYVLHVSDGKSAAIPLPILRKPVTGASGMDQVALLGKPMSFEAHDPEAAKTIKNHLWGNQNAVVD